MKRKLISIGLLGCLLLSVFALSTAAFADNGQQQLPNPGILPDSPFYFLNKLGKDVSMFFTFSNQAKAEKALNYAAQSLAAAQAMKEKGKDNLVAKTAEDYQKYMQQVQQRLQSETDNSTSANLSERVALATGFHLSVLDGLSGNLTGQAAEAINHALQESADGQEQALKVLARHHAEQALKIAGDTINEHLQALHDRLQQGFSGNLTGGLNITGNLTALENQLSAAAEQQGVSVTTIQQWLSQTTSQRLNTLSQVYDKVPEQAKEAIQHAAENSFKLFQRAIDRLNSDNESESESRNFSGNFTSAFRDFSDNFTGFSGNFSGFSGNFSAFSGNFSGAQSLLNKLGEKIRERFGLNGSDNGTGFSGNFTFRHTGEDSSFSANTTGSHDTMRPAPTESRGTSDNESDGHSVGTHNP